MAPHSSTLAWKIPWREEPGRLQSMGPLRVRHDWVTSLSRIGEGNGNPLQCSCLENPRDGGAWWAAVNGVAQNWTRLKQLSSSSSLTILYLGVEFCLFILHLVSWVLSFFSLLGNLNCYPFKYCLSMLCLSFLWILIHCSLGLLTDCFLPYNLVFPHP